MVSYFWTEPNVLQPLPAPFAVRLERACDPRAVTIATQCNVDAMHAQVLQVVEAITHCLDLTSEVLVVAIVCIEAVLKRCRAGLHEHTLRPILIAACVIALKFNDDFHFSMTACWKRLRTAFNNLDFDWLLAAEEQMLLAIDFHLPFGNIYQVYADALYRVANEWTGEERVAPTVLANDFWPT